MRSSVVEVGVLAVLFTLGLGFGVAGTSAQELADEFRRFLNEEAVYIITDAERERFLALRDDAERRDFIRNFWLIRDPVPETATNEFAEEHFQRVEEANRKYRESRAGWRTDRGRTYITLGPPQDVMSYPSSVDLYPLEIWFYYNLDIPLFPSSLQLMFFKRNGVGEYRLFSPAFDGMKALIANPVTRGMIGVQGQIPFSARQSWDIDIIKAAESVGAGENMLSSEQVLGDLRTPGFVFEKTNRNLAERVTAEASFGEELPVDFSVSYFRGDGAFTEAHVALEIAAADLNVNQYDDRLLGRYDVIASLRPYGSGGVGDVLEEIRDTLEIEVNEDAWETVRFYPVLFQRKVALLPGVYELEIFVRDFVGRRLGIVNRRLAVPAFPDDRPSLSSLVAAFKADEVGLGEGAASETPLRFGHLRLYPRPSEVFGAGQRVVTFIKLYCPKELFAETPEVATRFTLKRGEATVLDDNHRFRGAPGEDAVEILKVLPGESLVPGDYTLEVLLSEPVTSFEELARLDFTVAGPQEMGRFSTVAVNESPRPAERYYREARHFLAAERFEDAISRFAVVLDYEPFFQQARLGKARAEILAGKPEEGEASAREALQRDSKDVEAMALVGLALFRQGRLDEAAAMYRSALVTGGDVPGLLNALGETEAERGNVEAAVDALERSLELEPEQPDVREFLGRVKPR